MGYEAAPEFKENDKNPLIELNLADTSELWLIQLPLNQPLDFNGQEVTLKLHHDGHLGSFDGASGKSYNVVSFASQHPDATVFSSSASKSKIVNLVLSGPVRRQFCWFLEYILNLLRCNLQFLRVGKISRRVSLVHYPEPDELQKQNSNILKHMNERSATLTNSSHRYATPTQSTRTRHFQSGSGLTLSHGKGSLFGSERPSKAPKRKYVDEPTRSEMKQAQSSGRNVVGSLGHSEEKKSKKLTN